MGKSKLMRVLWVLPWIKIFLGVIYQGKTQNTRTGEIN